MEWWVTVLWIVGGLIVLIWLLVTVILLYLIKEIGFRNVRLLVKLAILLKAYFQYRDRFFR